MSLRCLMQIYIDVNVVECINVAVCKCSEMFEIVKGNKNITEIAIVRWFSLRDCDIYFLIEEEFSTRINGERVRKKNETTIQSGSLRPVIIPAVKKKSLWVNMMNDRALALNVILWNASRKGVYCFEALNRKIVAYTYINTVSMDLRSIRGKEAANKSPGLYFARIKSVDKAPLAKSDRGKSAKSELARYARLRVYRVLIEDSHVILLSVYRWISMVYVFIKIRWATIIFVIIKFNWNCDCYAIFLLHKTIYRVIKTLLFIR